MLYKDKLKHLRERNGLKQSDIADIIGVHPYVYGQYEREYVIMPIKHLNTICNYFNVSLDYMFGFSDKLNYKNSINNINKVNVGIRLKEFRKENKLTQVKLASILKTVHPTITNYENGKHLISTPFLYDICKKYKISADYLLGKINTPIYLKEKVIV